MASYPDAYVDDGWIWCYYDVTDTANPTTLLYSSSVVNQFDASFEIDGVSVAKAQTYQFSTTGEHLVKMKVSDSLQAATFRAVNTLKRIYIPSVITQLLSSGNGGGIFWTNTGITYVYLPETLTSIGIYTFYGCSNLEVVNLDLPELTTIGYGAFQSLSKLTGVINFPSLTSIGTSAFYSTKITRIDSLGEITTLPDNGNSGVFAGCKSLTKVVLPVTLTNIGRAAFYNCTSLTEVIFENAATVTNIAYLAFRDSPITGELNFPNLTTIGDQAFRAAKITSVKNLGNITTVTAASDGNGGAFRLCSELKSVTIPASVTEIQRRAFYQCSKLDTVICYPVTPPTYGADCISTNVQKIYVNPQSVDTYKSATGWSSFSAKIFPLWPETPIAINHLSLGDFRRRIMMGISRPSGYPDPWVDDGKIWAYYNVTTTESATGLCYSTSAVSKMEIDGVEVTKATSYQFATTGEHLVKYTMNGTDIPTRFFRERPVVRVYMPDIIETLSGANGAQFSTCTRLTFVRFSANLTQISYQGFTGCTSLVINNLKLPKLESIGSNGLRRTKTHKITDLGKITAIPSGYVFANISTLEVVILPDTLTSIGDRAFSSSGSSCVLTCLATTPPTLGANVFASFSCSKVLVPASSVEAYKTAWSGLANKIEAIPTT